MTRPIVLRLAALLLVTLALAGCGAVRDVLSPPVRRVPPEWRDLLGAILKFESRIGFEGTPNFRETTTEQEAYPFCGRAPRTTLPWSYEDPAIEWKEGLTEAECDALGGADDVFYGRAERWGESATPVTAAMVSADLGRFVYLVVHENCHDQFDLPYGIEEALCDLVAHEALPQFARERFAPQSAEARTIVRYAETQVRHAHATIAWYERLEALYARHAAGRIRTEQLLQERAVLLREAGQALDWKRGVPSPVGLASHMTYSRHYPALERIHLALGRDLARTMAFFRQVDRVKPSRIDVQRQEGIADAEGVALLRAYESAVLAVAERELKAERSRRP